MFRKLSVNHFYVVEIEQIYNLWIVQHLQDITLAFYAA